MKKCGNYKQGGDEMESKIDTLLDMKINEIFLTMQEEFGIACNLGCYPIACLNQEKDQLAFSYMGERIVIAKVKEIFNNNNILKYLLPGVFKDIIINAKFSPDGKYLTAISNNEMIIWNTENRDITRKIDYWDRIQSIDYSPNGKQLVITNGKKLIVMDIESQVIIDSINGQEPFTDAFFENEHSILYITLSGKILRWNYAPLCDLMKEAQIWIRDRKE